MPTLRSAYNGVNRLPNSIKIGNYPLATCIGSKSLARWQDCTSLVLGGAIILAHFHQFAVKLLGVSFDMHNLFVSTLRLCHLNLLSELIARVQWRSPINLARLDFATSHRATPISGRTNSMWRDGNCQALLSNRGWWSKIGGVA